MPNQESKSKPSDSEQRSGKGLSSSVLFSIGDKVKFVKMKIIGNSREFRTMEGKIEAFSEPLGLRVLVKYHGGNKVWRKLEDIRRLDQPSPLNCIIGMENDQVEARRDKTPPSQ